MNPTRPEAFRALFPQVVYETHRYRVVARLVECKTVPDSIRFTVEGAVVDSMGKLAWSVDQVSQRSRMDMLEESLEAFVAAKAEECSGSDVHQLEQVVR